MKRRSDFPVAVVQSNTRSYSKKFHSHIFTLFASCESAIYTFAQLHTPHYQYGFALTHNEEAEWCGSENLEEVRDWVLGHPKETQKLYLQWKKYWKKFSALNKKIDTTRLEDLTDAKLYSLFEAFHSAYLLVGGVGYIADSFMSVGAEDWLEVLIKKDLQTLAVSPEKISHYLKVLTTICTPSYSADVIDKVTKIAVNLEQFSTGSGSEVKRREPAISRTLKRLEQKYHWINNNYHHVEYLNAEHFYREAQKVLEEAKKKKTTVTALLSHHTQESVRTKQEQSHLLQTLSLHKSTRSALKLAELFAIWKDMRKSGVCIAMYYYDLFLKEIAQRTGYSLDDLQFLIFYEIKPLWFDKINLDKVIRARRELCFNVVTPKGYFIVEGNEAKKYFEKAGEEAHMGELRGMVACSGYVKGVVRVIRKTEEMRSFREGEILVTNQTTPEFVPIMKKCAAIITEQGGITSHAAIISRELKKPCIIGTKIATSILHTGEVVVVDANKGIIRREG